MNQITSKAQIINQMCFTFHHGYGLPAVDESQAFFGMTQKEKDHIRINMLQLFECFEPIYNEYVQLKTGVTAVCPVDNEHAEFLIRLGQFYLDSK